MYNNFFVIFLLQVLHLRFQFAQLLSHFLPKRYMYVLVLTSRLVVLMFLLSKIKSTCALKYMSLINNLGYFPQNIFVMSIFSDTFGSKFTSWLGCPYLSTTHTWLTTLYTPSSRLLIC